MHASKSKHCLQNEFAHKLVLSLEFRKSGPEFRDARTNDETLLLSSESGAVNIALKSGRSTSELIIAFPVAVIDTNVVVCTLVECIEYRSSKASTSAFNHSTAWALSISGSFDSKRKPSG